ncbi:MAG: transglutaminase-like domain-containing protein [Zavarzinella sp.]
MRKCSLIVLSCITTFSLGAEPKADLSKEVQAALLQAGENRAELELALKKVPQEERAGMIFIIANMQENDLKSLKAEYLLKNSHLAYQARTQMAWGKKIPEEIFFNYVLPYANIDEQRDDWRTKIMEIALPMVRECKTATEAAVKLNKELFPKLKVGYSTQRRAANQGPLETMESGKASCTGLSILLSDACRSVGIPTRLVGTPLWTNKRGNHTWLEIWDGDWHFTGACEQDPRGLDFGWFTNDASKAIEDQPLHAIYAASFKKTNTPFPLVWAPRNKTISAENVTKRYAAKAEKGQFRLQVTCVDGTGKRIAEPIQVLDSKELKVIASGNTKDETADTNDFLTFQLPTAGTYIVKRGSEEQQVTFSSTEKEKLIRFPIKK